MYSEKMIVNLPVEKVYKAILNYIRTGPISKYVEIKHLSEPLYIEVKTVGGSILKVNITLHDSEKCQVLLDLYPRSDIATIFVIVFFSIIMSFILRKPLISALTVGIIPIIVAMPREWNYYKEKIFDLLVFVERTGVIPEFKVEDEVKEMPPVDVLYGRLVDAYSRIYGSGKLLVNHKIESYIRKGLNREEAITKIAEEEGII